MARTGSSKAHVRDVLTERFGYDLSRTIEQIRPGARRHRRRQLLLVLAQRRRKHIQAEAGMLLGVSIGTLLVPRHQFRISGPATEHDIRGLGWRSGGGGN